MFGRSLAIPTLSPRSAVVLGSGTILVAALDSAQRGFRFHAVNPLSGAILRRDTLVLGEERLRGGDRLSAYRHELCARPGGEEVAAYFFHAGRIDILDTNGTLIRQVDAPFAFRPIPEPNPLTRAPSFKNGSSHVRFAYLDCTGTQGHLWVLFSGRLVGTRAHPIPESPSAIHVFDWEGKLLRIFVLDHRAHSIAIDPIHNLLYSLAEGGEGAVRVTRIPGLAEAAE